MKKSVVFWLGCILVCPLMVQAEENNVLLEQELANIDNTFILEEGVNPQESLLTNLQEKFVDSNYIVSVPSCDDNACLVQLSLVENETVSATKKVEIVVLHTTSETKEQPTTTYNTYDQTNSLDGWVTIDEHTYYYLNGEKLIGFQEIEGETYYFGSDGSMYKGILDLDGKKYLFGEKSGKLYRSGLATTNSDGKTYYCGSDGVLLLGFQDIEGDTYYFGNDGSMYKGVLDLDGKKYLLGEKSGKLYCSGLATTNSDGNTYYCGSDGVLLLGFQDIEGDTYYFGNDGSMYKGILDLNGKKYLLGEKSGKLYRSGLATTNSDGKTYYCGSDGVLLLGFQDIEGDTYYFGNDGSMYKGILDLNGKKYLLGEKSGKLYHSGFVTTNSDGKTYYSDKNGVLLLGWQKIGEDTYYFAPEMYKGIVEMNDKRYLFGFTSGKLYIGWAKVPNGDMYYTDASGVIQTGYQMIDGNAYLFDDEGVLQTGWQEIDGKTYYFYADGSRATFLSKIAGVRYEFSATGELQYSNIKLIIDVSYHQGNIDWDTLWNSGEIDGVILRIAAGCEQEDTMLASYIENVKRLGIPYGIYIYSYAENYHEGILYANFTQNVINKYNLNPTLGIYLDLESNSITDYMGVSQYEEVVKGFMSVIPTAKVYTYTYYAETALNSDYIKPYITWIANREVTDRPGNYQGWQFTNSALVPGINGGVDMSIFYY